jgi:7,8-dihydro-6-hydroxymethylpterin dimethyltransferase
MKLVSEIALRAAPTIDRADLAKPLRAALQKHGLWTPHQTAARRWPMGCISLEVTQRCNLDCTLCYLSEHSEAVHDFPLQEIFRRIDLIFDHYGHDTDIQISGGDPTLRDHDDLEAIVRYINAMGMRSSLFTNGILATRTLLSRLAAAGMTDVAFHVDLTQERKGFESEAMLNKIRCEYIERARGLGLSVFFNTSVFAGNIEEVPMLARFFAEHSDIVRLASFQMQAQTGRGVLEGMRAGAITQQRVMAMIAQGAGTTLNFDALIGGSPTCNRYATAITFGRGAATRAHDLFRNGNFIARVMRETADLRIDRANKIGAAKSVVREILKRPTLALQGIAEAAEVAWRARADLFRAFGAQGGLQKISYFIHNFMDASALEQDRLDTCVFMAATQVGPVPMCEFNANRDAYLLRPLMLADGALWQPLAGRSKATIESLAKLRTAPQISKVYPIKFLKGRAREIANAARHKNKVPHESI